MRRHEGHHLSSVRDPLHIVAVRSAAVSRSAERAVVAAINSDAVSPGCPASRIGAASEEVTESAACRADDARAAGRAAVTGGYTRAPIGRGDPRGFVQPPHDGPDEEDHQAADRGK